MFLFPLRPLARARLLGRALLRGSRQEVGAWITTAGRCRARIGRVLNRRARLLCMQRADRLKRCCRFRRAGAALGLHQERGFNDEVLNFDKRPDPLALLMITLHDPAFVPRPHSFIQAKYTCLTAVALETPFPCGSALVLCGFKSSSVQSLPKVQLCTAECRIFCLCGSGPCIQALMIMQGLNKVCINLVDPGRNTWAALEKWSGPWLAGRLQLQLSSWVSHLAT